MKKVLLPLVIVSAVLFTACNSKKETKEREMVLLTDSMYKSNLGSDTAAITQPTEAAVEAEPQIAAPVAKTRRPAPRRNNATYNQPVRDNSASTTAPVAEPTTTAPTTAPATGTETAGTGTTTTTPEVKKKEGMSKAAQGAIIGGVGGAVAGAIISKKKGTGAVIGGVIGAAGGYILGRKKDKNDGRVTTDTSKN